MNRKSPECRALMLRLMCNGSTVRFVAEAADVSINTVLSFLAEAGAACRDYHDRTVRNLDCRYIEADAAWSFNYAKQKNLPKCRRAPKNAGDVWTWTAICRESKLLVAYLDGGRGADYVVPFLKDLASRLDRRVQLTTDGDPVYPEAVDLAFGSNVDYAVLKKALHGVYDHETRARSVEVVAIHKEAVTGNPDPAYISTSFVERQNLTIRHFIRRLARDTPAFSKKFENHVHAFALYAIHYNFVRQHGSLKKLSPAMAAGVTQHLWSIEDMGDMVDAYSAAKGAEAHLAASALPALPPLADPATATHFVYHSNWHRYTKVHRAECKNCNRGHGRGGASDMVEWFACESLEVATELARRLRPDRYSTCTLCIRLPDGSSARRRR